MTSGTKLKIRRLAAEYHVLYDMLLNRYNDIPPKIATPTPSQTIRNKLFINIYMLRQYGVGRILLGRSTTW